MPSTTTLICVLALGWSVALPAGARATETDAPLITLAQAHQRALDHNWNARSLEETLAQAEILRWRAYAILLPSVWVDGSLTLNDKEIGFDMPDFEGLIAGAVADATGQPAPPLGAGQATVIQERWAQHVGVTANIAIFNAQSIPLLKSAYDNEDAARLDVQHQRRQLLFAVSAAYYGVRAAEESLVLAAEDVTTAQRFLRLAEQRKAVGQAVGLEVLRARIAVREAEKQQQNAQDSVRLARASLGYLIGVEGPFRVADPPAPRVPEGDLPALTQQALDARPDLSALRVRGRMAAREKTRTWTRFIPTFDLTWNGAWDSATGFGGEHTSWRLIFGARWGLLDAGQKIMDLYEHDSRIRLADYQAAQLELTIREEVEKDAIELQRCRRNMALAEEQIELARENHRLVETSYQNGLVRSLDVLDATATLSRARQALVLETLSCDMATLAIRRALGEDATDQ